MTPQSLQKTCTICDRIFVTCRDYYKKCDTCETKHHEKFREQRQDGRTPVLLLGAADQQNQNENLALKHRKKFAVQRDKKKKHKTDVTAARGYAQGGKTVVEPHLTGIHFLSMVSVCSSLSSVWVMMGRRRMVPTGWFHAHRLFLMMSTSLITT